MKRARHKKQRKQRSWGGTRDPTMSKAAGEQEASRQVDLVRKQNRLLNNGAASDGYQNRLAGLGIRASITGKHAYYVITDDICNRDDRMSRVDGADRAAGRNDAGGEAGL